MIFGLVVKKIQTPPDRNVYCLVLCLLLYSQQVSVFTLFSGRLSILASAEYAPGGFSRGKH